MADLEQPVLMLQLGDFFDQRLLFLRDGVLTTTSVLRRCTISLSASAESGSHASSR